MSHKNGLAFLINIVACKGVAHFCVFCRWRRGISMTSLLPATGAAAFTPAARGSSASLLWTWGPSVPPSPAQGLRHRLRVSVSSIPALSVEGPPSCQRFPSPR